RRPQGDHRRAGDVMSADFDADTRAARYDQTNDPDLHDAGEHPALDEGWRMAAALDRLDDALTPAQEARLGAAQEAAELAHLEHPRLRDAVLNLRAQTDMDAPAWWDAYRALMDVAERIERAS